MRTIIIGLLALAAILVAGNAEARIRYCSSTLPSDVREAIRDLNYCLKGGSCAGLNATVFNNDQKRLPAVGHNENYYEGRVGEDRSGGPGKRRLVFLVQGNAKTSSAQILDRYFTADHYVTFCEIPN